jgi:hypothetical protein
MLPSFGRTSTGPQVALRVTATGQLSIADAGTPTVTLAQAGFYHRWEHPGSVVTAMRPVRLTT